MPHDVQPFVNGLVEKISIHGMQEDIWETVRDTLISYPTTVTTNTVIAIYRSGTQFLAREVGMHRAERPLGYHFSTCGISGCPSKGRPGHIIGELRNQDSARIRCKACLWKSKWVKLDKQNYITPLHTVKAPLLFYHDFPSPAGLSTLFADK
jgi:hypothetical protein